MLFSAERDTGSSISFYLIPDSGGSVPSVRITGDGHDLLTMDANNTRQEIIASGRHATGLCGFLVDDSLIPNLSTYTDLEINEAGSGLLVYRRPQPNFAANKVFRLETHLLPLWRLDDVLRSRFQYWYKGIDRQGRETSTQVFHIHECASCFISGRLMIKPIEFYLTKGFRSVVIFRDPYEELAERLIVLKSMTPKTVELLGERDALTFESVMRYLADFEQFDEVSCKRLFKKAPDEVLVPLANPFVRQLTVTAIDERASKKSIAPALQVLSDFEIIGLRSEAADFSHALAEMTGIAPDTLPVMSEYSRVSKLAEILRSIRATESLLEFDLEIFHHTKQAFGTLG